jgi:hypothetical protein
MADASERDAGPWDVAAFLATAIASFALRWDLAELVWGLWLSSLAVGYALIVFGILSAAARPLPAAGITLPAGAGAAVRIAGAAFMVAFFSVHFGGFHFVHGIFLGVFFPLAPGEPGPDAVAANAGLALQSSWPLVLSTAVSMRGAFERAGREFAPQTPYVSVVRMHLLIFVFAGAKALQLDNRWLYLVVLFFYFFPIGVLRRLWRRTT